MVASGGKGILMTASVQAPTWRPCRFETRASKWMAVGFVALLAMTFLHAYLLGKFLSAALLDHTGNGDGTAKICPQSDVLYPESHALLWKGLGRDFDDDEFMTRVVTWLGGAVRIPYVFFYRMFPALWHFVLILMLNEVRSHTIIWAPSVRTSGGRLLGRSMTTSNKHFLSRP